MENTISKDKEIISKIIKENGWVPNPLKLMERRPGTVEKFMSYNNHVFEKGTLNKREKALISLVATVLLKASHCIQVKVEEAKNAGITEDEIVQTLLIASIINGN